MLTRTLLLAALCASATPALADTVYVRAGRLIDPEAVQGF